MSLSSLHLHSVCAFVVVKGYVVAAASILRKRSIMAKFLVAIVLVLAVSALASPTTGRDEAIKKAIEAQRMAAKASELPVDIPTVETPTETPVVAEKPVVAEEPVVAEKPIVAEEPVVADKSVVVEEPVIAEKPVVAEEPIVDEKPAVAAEPVAVETPVVAEKPVVAEEPVVAEKP